MKTRNARMLAVVLFILTVLVLFWVKSKPENITQSKELILKTPEGTVYLKHDLKIQEEEFSEFITVTKNNYMRDFLTNNRPKFFFLDIYRVEVTALEHNGNYGFETSFEIAKGEKEYIKGYLNKISGFLQEQEVEKLVFNINFPLSINDKRYPPPPLHDFYGNIPGGRLPELMENAFKH